MDIKLMTNGLFYIDDDDLDWFYGDYQKGDRVRCVDSCDEPSVTTGKVYTVTKIEDMEFIEILWLIDDTGDINPYPSWMFEPANGKCDCGGETAKTGHASWCSTRK